MKWRYSASRSWIDENWIHSVTRIFVAEDVSLFMGGDLKEGLGDSLLQYLRWGTAHAFVPTIFWEVGPTVIACEAKHEVTKKVLKNIRCWKSNLFVKKGSISDRVQCMTKKICSSPQIQCQVSAHAFFTINEAVPKCRKKINFFLKSSKYIHVFKVRHCIGYV